MKLDIHFEIHLKLLHLIVELVVFLKSK